MKKQYAAVVFAAMMAAAGSFTAWAGAWEQSGTDWKYMQDDGTYAANGWHWIDGNGDGSAECYYFDGDGLMAANTVTPDGYQVDGNGAWIVDGQIRTKSMNVSSDGYTDKISNKVWELMNNSYEQNEAKYGNSAAPYSLTYYNFFPDMTEEESLQARAYILEFNSANGPLTTVFEDAPQVTADTSLEEVADYLEDLGYEVKWGRTGLNTNDACWISVNRFEVAFVKESDGSFDIRIRQDKIENIKRIVGAMNTPTAVSR